MFDSLGLNSQHAEEVKRNGNNLKTIIKCVYFLAQQGLAFRGHDESVNSQYQRNFLELVSFLSDYNIELSNIYIPMFHLVTQVLLVKIK